MLARGIAPASDELGVFPALLDHLRDVRVRAKHLARSAEDPQERAHQHALQQTFKILINAFYGYLAFSSGHFNDFAAADRVTAEGRAVVTTIVDRLTALGAVPIEADTDGVYFLAPPDHQAGARRAAAGGDRRRPARGHRARARRPARRDAVLQDEDLRACWTRAAGCTSRARASARAGLEPFQRRLIEEVVRLLLEGKRASVRAGDRSLVDSVCHSSGAGAAVRAHRHAAGHGRGLSGARAGRASRALGGLRAGAGHGPRMPAGRSDLVLRRRPQPQRGGQRVRHGWPPSGIRARPDENVEYYQSKVLEIWDRFRRFTEQEGLQPFRDEPEENTAQLSFSDT